MALVCGFCGAENRDRARFCRGCARPLSAAHPGAAGPAGSGAEHRAGRRAKRLASAEGVADGTANHTSGAEAGGASIAGQHRLRVAALALLPLLALVLGIGWLVARPSVPAQASHPVAGADAAIATVSATAPASPATGDHGAAVFAALEAARAASAVPVSAPAPARRDPQPAALRARAPAPPKPAVLPAKAPAASEPVPVAAVTPPPAPAAPVAPPQTPPPSVEQACAGSGNFLARDICRLKACGQPAAANDPVCVRYREMEAANRRDPDR